MALGGPPGGNPPPVIRPSDELVVPRQLTVNDVHWKKHEDDTYQSAQNYLSLRFDPRVAAYLRAELEQARPVEVRINDVLRAFRREPLPVSDPGVRRVREKIAAGEKLHPPLLVSFNDGGDIADGYHRISTIYWLPEGQYAEIPAKIAYLR